MDGVYFDKYEPTRSELTIADAEGRNSQNLVSAMQFDSDGSFVLQRRAIGSFNLSASRHARHLSRPRRQFRTGTPARFCVFMKAVLSPNSQCVTFVSTCDRGSTDSYTMDGKARKVRNLTNSPRASFLLSWFPDEKSIVFTPECGTDSPHADEVGTFKTRRACI